MRAGTSSPLRRFEARSKTHWGPAGVERTDGHGTLQAKQLQHDQNFMAQSHFRLEKADIVNGSLPHVVTAEDVTGDAPPMSEGLLLYPGIDLEITA